MELLGWMLLGLLVGIVARFIFQPRPGSGAVLFILLGIAGAMLAGFVWHAAAPGIKPGSLSFAAAAIGAVAMILFYQSVLRYRR